MPTLEDYRNSPWIDRNVTPKFMNEVTPYDLTSILKIRLDRDSDNNHMYKVKNNDEYLIVTT